MQNFVKMGFISIPVVLLVLQACVNSVSSTSPGLTIICGDTIEITIRASEYAAIGIVDINSDDLYINSSQVEDLSKVETNCRPLAQSSELISFQNFNISECGAVASMDDNFLYYNFTIWRDHRRWGSDLITRGEVTGIEFQCIYEATKTLDAAPPITPLVLTGHYVLGAVAGVFKTQLLMYKDSGFSSVFNSGDPVYVDDKVYVEFSLEGFTAEKFPLSVQLLRCYAHPTSTREETYLLIDNQCPVSHSWDPAIDPIAVISSGEANTARFSFKSFVWTPSITSEIFITCHSRLCDPSQETCTKSCSSRRKRGADDTYNSSTVIVTSPSLKVLNREKRDMNIKSGKEIDENGLIF